VQTYIHREQSTEAYEGQLLLPHWHISHPEAFSLFDLQLGDNSADLCTILPNW